MKPGWTSLKTMSYMSREMRRVIVVFAAIAGLLVWKTCLLPTNNMLFHYPYVMFDSFQWVTDGLFYWGYPVTPTFRAPLVPLVLGFLGALSLDFLLPYFNAALLFLFSIYTYLFAKRFAGSVSALLVTCCLFLNFSIQNSFDMILADQWAITLLLISLYHLRRAKNDIRHIFPCALAGALSFLSQYAIAFVSIGFLVYFITDIFPAQRQTKYFLHWLVLSMVMVLVLLTPYFAYKAIRFGSPLYEQVVHFQLLKWHAFGVAFYAVNGLAFYGIPNVVVAVLGMLSAVTKRSVPAGLWISFLCCLVFWVLLYQWLDTRFVLYTVPFLIPFLALGFEQLRSHGLFACRGAPLWRVALSAGLLLLILIFGLHNRGDAFARQWLAITPWHVLEFPCIQVTAFEGNMDIEWRKPKLIAQGPLPLFHFNNYYRPAPMDGTLGKMLADCMAMRTWCERNLPDKRAPVGLKSTVMCDYYAQKRFSYALRRDVLTNISSSVYICDATTALRNGEQLCIRGTLFNLVRSEAQ